MDILLAMTQALTLVVGGCVLYALCERIKQLAKSVDRLSPPRFYACPRPHADEERLAAMLDTTQPLYPVVDAPAPAGRHRKE